MIKKKFKNGVIQHNKVISNKDQNVFILLSIKEFVLKKKSVKSVLVTFAIFGFSFVYVANCKPWPNVAPFDNHICHY